MNKFYLLYFFIFIALFNFNAFSQENSKNLEIKQKQVARITIEQFFQAIKNNDLRLINEAIDCGFDLNQVNKEEIAPFLYAARIGNIEVIELLIKKDKNILNQKHSKNGSSAIHFAAQGGHEKLIKLLIDKYNVSVDLKNNNRNTALLYAAMCGRIKIIKLLIDKYNVDLNQKDKFGSTALIIASGYGQLEIVNLLLSTYNVDVNQKNNQNNNALIIAAWMGHIEVVKLLKEKYNIDIEFKNNDDESAFLFASAKGHKEIVKLLIKCNCNINITNPIGGNALACALGQYKIANENIKKNNFKKIISILILQESQQIEKLKEYNLSKFAKNVKDIYGILKLGLSLQRVDPKDKLDFFNQSYSLIKKVIKQGADLMHMEDIGGNNPLHLAILGQNIELAALILSVAPRLISFTNDKNQTPVELAIAGGHNDFVFKLIELGKKGEKHE